MTARTIHMLLDYLPDHGGVRGLDHYQVGLNEGPHDSEVEKFAVAYSDLSVGWKIARRLAELEMTFPSFICGHDLYLRNAYLHCLDPEHYPCKYIRHARYLASAPELSDPINGLLLSEGMSYGEIAAEMGLAPEVVAAYEKLFFNVVDRHMDHLFIRNVVYPNGRMVEMYENYLENEGLGNILKRVGFNNGREDVLYFAGFRSGLLGSLAQQNMPVKLESIIMANGYLLAKNGWANQREHASGLSSARNLIAAAKHGGQEAQTDSAFTDYGNILVTELLDMKGAEALARPVLAEGLPAS